MRQLKITKSISFRTPITEMFLNEVSREELITVEEEVRLARLIKQGDKSAENKLVKANLRFVVSVAKQYQGQGVEYADLINEGNLGLIKAAKRFDETRGFKFISYAVWWIRQSISQSINDHSRIVRMPGNKVSLLNKFRKIFNSLEQELERIPTLSEMQEHIKVDELTYTNFVIYNHKHFSLDSKINSDSNESFLDFLPDEEAQTDISLNKESLHKDLRLLMQCLTPKEKRVLDLWAGFDKKDGQFITLEEIGTMEELSKERVRQIKEKALKKLRMNSKANELRAYLS